MLWLLREIRCLSTSYLPRPDHHVISNRRNVHTFPLNYYYTSISLKAMRTRNTLLCYKVTRSLKYNSISLTRAYQLSKILQTRVTYPDSLRE